MSKMSLKDKISSVTMNSVCSAIIVVMLATLPFIWSCSNQGQMDNSSMESASAVSSAEQDSQESAEKTAPAINEEEHKNYYVSSSEDFENYSFICPDSWTLYESGKGARVLIKNSNSISSKAESIFIFVDDVSNNVDAGDDESVVAMYNLILEGDRTVNMLNDGNVTINNNDATLVSYEYESSLDSDSGDKKIKCVDCFTFIRSGNYIYAIKYIGKGISGSGAQQTFKNFVSGFKLDSLVKKQKQKDKNSAVNILILGDDSGMGRPGGRVNGRTDIIIVLHLNPDTGKGTAVTIPRDTWVDIPGQGENKINGAHAVGGNDLTVRTIEQLTGLEIDNYIITDFDGFIPLIDFLGGVTIEVGEDLHDDFSGCYLTKGVHHLDGKTALALARNRHRSGDGTTQGGAFAREREAAKIIVALLDQKSSFERIAAMPLFINYLLKYTWTDLSFMDILRLLPVLGQIKANDIEITGIPSWPQAIGNASAVVYDKEATEELFEDVKNQ